MLRPVLASVCGVLLLASCGDDRCDQKSAWMTGQSTSTPIVAIVPVIDSTRNDLSWSLSEEMTLLIQHRLAQRGKLFLVDLDKVKVSTKKVGSAHNPFGTDLAWMKSAFSSDEFVVFLELVEHEELFLNDKANPLDAKYCAAELSLGMRVRVVDLREKEPKIALQELVTTAHHLPKQFTSVNFGQAPWGDEYFTTSPLGLAHTEFAKEISSRIEDYILLSE